MGMNKPEISSDLSAPLAKREALVLELKALIIHALNLHHIQPEQILPETSFGPGGLNLDSVDILEVVVAVEQGYKVKVKDAQAGQKHFGSLSSIADFILEQSA
jgi:acyl carrier protein